jgi:hypothetical protein
MSVHSKRPFQRPARALASTAKTALEGLQATIDVFQVVAGDLGIPGLQSGVGALSTILKMAQVHITAPL